MQADVVDMILVDPKILLNAQTQAQQLSPETAAKQAPPQGQVSRYRKQLSGTGRLLSLASELQVPLAEVLQMCSSGSGMCDWQAADVAAKVAAISGALGLTAVEARSMIKQQPSLLEVPPESLSERGTKVLSLLGLPADGGASGRKLLAGHPELLVQEPGELDGRIEQLAAQLNLPLARMPGLLEACPVLILQSSGGVVQRLEAIRQLLGGVSPGLVAELVAKEPRVLSTSLPELEAAYEELASSFGSFREDALQLILADPSMLLKGRASTAGFGTMDRGEEVQQEQEVRQRKGKSKKARAKDGSAMASMASMASMDGDSAGLSIEEILGIEAEGDSMRRRKNKTPSKQESDSVTSTAATSGGRYLKNRTP